MLIITFTHYVQYFPNPNHFSLNFFPYTNVFDHYSWSTRRRQWHPTPVLLPGKSHEWRSLVGCSPWGCEELDTTERLHFHFSLSYIGEGNANLLQCSCLENLSDGGAWWDAVYGVAQSRTRLKWLISSMVYQQKLLNLLLLCFLWNIKSTEEADWEASVGIPCCW